MEKKKKQPKKKTKNTTKKKSILTTGQERVWHYILSSTDKPGSEPSIHQIAEDLDMTASGVYDFIKLLIKKRFLLKVKISRVDAMNGKKSYRINYKIPKI